jgi:hypothetical protein
VTEKPRCSSCIHYGLENHHCEQGLPEVTVIAAKSGDPAGDRFVTAWRTPEPTDGCANHQDFSKWALEFNADKTKLGRAVDSNMIDPLGPYNCPCVMLQKANKPNRVDIEYNGRSLSSQLGCEICNGSGVVPKDKMHEGNDYGRPTEETPLRTDAGWAFDENGDIVTVGAGNA